MRRTLGLALLVAVALLPGASDPYVADAQTATQPRIGRIWFTIDPEGKHEIREITSGTDFFTFYEYFNVSAPNQLRHYALVNGSSDRVITTDPDNNGPLTPSVASGWMRKRDYTVYSAGGSIYTIIVELNGQEVGRQNIPVK